jgi:hypothetical protein
MRPREGTFVMEFPRVDTVLSVVLVSCQAIFLSGSEPLLARLIENAWVTVLLAGNGLAAHDIEANMPSVDLRTGRSETTGCWTS